MNGPGKLIAVHGGYRHVMHEFYGFLLDIIHNPGSPEDENDELGKKLLTVLKRISELRDRELLIH
jgi:hypothetical protein